MSQSLAYDLAGQDRARFESYEAARSLQPKLREGASRDRGVEELAAQYGLPAEDVAMALYAFRVRRTARI